MTARRVPRPGTSLRDRWRGATHEPAPWPERLLQGLGAHPAFADAVLGDLAEERARRTAAQGPTAARWWYLREALRSAPYLLRNAAQHGGPRGRARAAMVVAAIALLPVAALLAIALRDGPPARLVIGAGDADGLVLNGLRPVQLSARVLDAAGHVLPSTGVRYRWERGTPVTVTPAGVVTCTQRGDAMLRASIGAVGTPIRLRCRPVDHVEAPPMIDLVVGDAAQDVAFAAVDSNGNPVTLLAGRIAVGDSSVVTLTGSRIAGRATGSTWVTVRMGDEESFSSVHVYDRAASLERIAPDQHLAVSVRLPGGGMREWRIPAGGYFLTMLADGAEDAKPRLAVVGANCMRMVGHLICAAPHGATLIAYDPAGADATRERRGALAVWRRDEP